MPLEWSDLPHMVERRRPAKADAAHVDRRGEVDPRLVQNDTAHGAGAEPQRIRMLIQPGAGKTDDLPEGVGATASHRGYCNFKTDKGKDAEATDIQPGDELRLLDKQGKFTGKFYWVNFVGDAGGQGDHLKLLLRTEDGK